MRLHPLPLLAALALVPHAGAQEIVRGAVIAPSVRAYTLGDNNPRAVLGLTTAPASGRRDTLGLLVTTIVPGGPAERAGIEEGNRLVSINGVNLRVAPADLEDRESAALVGRRLTRELSKAKPGESVELRVHTGGQQRTVRVATAAADTVYERRSIVREADDRAVIGMGLGATGSVRDTLGVFVMSVVDTGPAARAGIHEGHRIAAVNGVDLRVSRDDSGDPMVARIKANRLQRELARLSPGQEVELRVWAAGQVRTVRVRAVKASELAQGRTIYMSQEGVMPFTRFPTGTEFRQIAPMLAPSMPIRQLLRIDAPGEMRTQLRRLELDLQALEAAEAAATPAASARPGAKGRAEVPAPARRS